MVLNRENLKARMNICGVHILICSLCCFMHIDYSCKKSHLISSRIWEFIEEIVLDGIATLLNWEDNSLLVDVTVNSKLDYLYEEAALP